MNTRLNPFVSLFNWIKAKNLKECSSGKMLPQRLRRRSLKLEGLEERTLLAVTPGNLAAPMETDASAFIVTTLDDLVDAEDNVLSLREALAAAGDGDQITFAQELDGGTIELYRKELTVNKTVSIDASNLENGITVAADGRVRAFKVTGGTETASVQMINLTITGGHSSYGGGIYNKGVLTLVNTHVTKNTATSYGGGIYNEGGTLTLIDSSLTQNSAIWGGGLNNSGKAALRNVSILSNTFGGYVASYGAGIYNSGTLTAKETTVSQNAMKGDGSNYGGGIYNFGTMTFTNGLITYNASSLSGGGIANQGTLTITNATIAENTSSSGGGICNIAGSSTLYNSIVAQNYVKVTENDIVIESGDVAGYNNLSSFADWQEGASGSNLVYDDEQLLFTGAGNGNFKLCPDAQAVNQGNNDYAVYEDGTPILNDLRGRDRIVFDTVDMGAYEYPVPKTIQLETPTNLKAVANGTVVTVTWDTIEDANRYIVYYSDDPNNIMKNLLVSQQGRALISSEEIQSSILYITVKARDAYGTYADSNLAETISAIMITISTDSPTARTLLTASLPFETEGVKYQWYRVAIDGTETAIARKFSYRYKVAEADKGYYLKVTATNGEWTASAITADIVPLSTPNILLLKPKGTSLGTGWASVDGADTYIIQYSEDPTFVETVTHRIINTYDQANDLTLGHTYYVRMQAVDSTGIYLRSSWSAIKTVTLNKLGKPEITDIHSEGSSVTLGWTLVDEADRYVIYYSTDSEFAAYKTKIINDSQTNTTVISGLEMGNVYYFRIQARQMAGEYISSEFSNMRQIAVTRIAAPQITSLIPSGKTISISWTASEKANRYIITYSTDPNFSTSRNKTANNATTATIIGLTPGTTYYFKVQARDSSGVFYPSFYSEVQSVTLPALASVPNNFDEDFDFLDDEIIAALADNSDFLDVL